MNTTTATSFWRDEITGWLDVSVSTGRYSSLLVDELVDHHVNRRINTHAVMDEIAVLEGRKPQGWTRTKPASEFTRPPLKGLWHKHHFQAAFLPRNLENHWRRANRLERLMTSVNARVNTANDRANLLSHELVMGSYHSRSQSGKLTGEFIVYARHEGVNYYLTLGEHDEYDHIAQRVSLCAAEFPDVPLPGVSLKKSTPKESGEPS